MANFVAELVRVPGVVFRMRRSLTNSSTERIERPPKIEEGR